MKNMLFICRHVPTSEQTALAAAQGYRLVHVGDVDAFDSAAVTTLINTVPAELICKVCFGDINWPVGDDPECHGNYPFIDAVGCVHPAIALLAIGEGKKVGLFKNANRPPEGAASPFAPAELRMYKGEILDNGGDLYIRIREAVLP